MTYHQSSDNQVAVVQEFLHAFGFETKASAHGVTQQLFNQRQLIDLEDSKQYVDHFLRKCEKRDPTLMKPLRKRVSGVMNECPNMILMIDFVVRCRQAHLFRDDKPSNSTSGSMGSTTPTPSTQSSPFQRRSASRGRVLSTLTGDHHNLNESMTSRSRANSSFTSYDNRVERQIAGTARTRSPYQLPTTRVSPLTASNHLFPASNGYQSIRTVAPNSHLTTQRLREDSSSSYHNPQGSSPHGGHPPPVQLRQTPTSVGQHNITSTIRAPISNSSIPLHARLGNARTETETRVCECLLPALLGMETVLFAKTHLKMTIKSTASISVTHERACKYVLSVATQYLQLSHKEHPSKSLEHRYVTNALLAAIRQILGDYIADIDELNRMKGLKFHLCLPLIESWKNRIDLLVLAHNIRNQPQLDLLESLYVLHSSYSFETDRKKILGKILNYTMGVFCNQMMEWMTTGEVPVERWMIGKDAETGKIVLKRVPIFISEDDAVIMLEIGKSLPHVGSASDEDLESIDKATTVVRAALSPDVILRKELTPLLKNLRDVVCGIVMRMVLTTGRLKEHIHKATSFFFLSDPRFTTTLYTVIKEASMGLRVGSAALSRQTVSSALAAALEATTNTESVNDRKKKKLGFKLDAMTSLGSTPNVSSKMQFVQPLSPHYEPQMDLMKPIFSACDSEYESIFHMIWAIDLARYSTQEVVTLTLPGIMRFLVKNYSLRENASCLLNMLSHIASVVGALLLRVRALIHVQLRLHLARFLAQIDEKCVDVDDVIREHKKFVRRVTVIVFVRNNEKIEHELANLLRCTFEAQDFIREFSDTWNGVIENTVGEENLRKAQIAEMCQKRTLGARLLMDTINKCHKNLSDLIDEQITYGNDALLD